MAVIAPTIVAIGRGDGSTLMVTWTPVTNADTCRAVSFPECSDRSIHVYGTFGSASVALQGSNNGGASFASLNDPTETVIAITSEKIRAVLENSDQTKPLVSGGDGTQSLSIAILFHLTNPLRT